MAEGTIIEIIQDTIAPGLTVYDHEGKKVGTVWRIHRVPGYFQAQTNRLSEKDLHIPFRLITNIDPRELYLSVSRDELHRDYANPPPRSTRVEEEYGGEIAITTEPSGYDGAPVVVHRASVDDLKKDITVGDRVFSSDPTELGIVEHYDPEAGQMRIARDEMAKEPTLTVPVAIVDAVSSGSHEVYLVSSEADLERMEHLVPAHPESAEEFKDRA